MANKETKKTGTTEGTDALKMIEGQILELLAAREKELQTIQEQGRQARKETAALDDTVQNASRQRNYKLYTTAALERDQAYVIAERCNSDYYELKKKPVCDEKSVEIYKGLLKYKEQREAAFKASVRKALQEIETAMEEYKKDLKRAGELYVKAYLGDKLSMDQHYKLLTIEGCGIAYQELKRLLESDLIISPLLKG